MDQYKPRPVGHWANTELKTLDKRTITLRAGEANEPLCDGTHDINPADATSAITRLALFAFDDSEDAYRYAARCSGAILANPTVGRVLANRVYRDHLDCPDTA